MYIYEKPELVLIDVESMCVMCSCAGADDSPWGNG